MEHTMLDAGSKYRWDGLEVLGNRITEGLELLGGCMGKAFQPVSQIVTIVEWVISRPT